MKRSVDILNIPNDIFFEEVRNILASGRSATIRATGRSMTPTFRDALDDVVVSLYSFDSVEVGDVVLFDRGDTICLHRVIGKRPDLLVIRGDGNSHSALEYATADKLIGKVIGGTMNGGHPFTIEDRRWKRNTKFVLKYHLLLSIYHRILSLLRSYPLSVLALFTLLFLSFFKPPVESIPSFDYSDKLAHVLMYFALSSVFWFEWLRRRHPDRKAVAKGLIYCFLIPVILGGLIEFGQEYIVDYRNGDWMDCLANTVGCFLAALITFLRKYYECSDY